MKLFWSDEEGQGLVECGLIISVIAIAVIVAMAFLRDQISNIFSNIGNNLTKRPRVISHQERCAVGAPLLGCTDPPPQ